MKQIIEALEKSSEFFGDPKEGDNEYLFTLCNDAIKRAKDIQDKASEILDGLSQDAIDGGWNFKEMQAYTVSLEKRVADLHNQKPLGYCGKGSIKKYKDEISSAGLIISKVSGEYCCIPVYEKAGL